jgi:hypothetical protein
MPEPPPAAASLCQDGYDQSEIPAGLGERQRLLLHPEGMTAARIQAGYSIGGGYLNRTHPIAEEADHVFAGCSG